MIVFDDDDGATRMGTSELFFRRSSRRDGGPIGNNGVVVSVLEGSAGGTALFGGAGLGAALFLPSLDWNLAQLDMSAWWTVCPIDVAVARDATRHRTTNKQHLTGVGRRTQPVFLCTHKLQNLMPSPQTVTSIHLTIRFYTS